MDWAAFQGWLLTGALAALCVVIWDARNKLEAKHKEQGNDLKNAISALTEKTQEIHDLMRTELRAMDVRIARIEAHIWPHQPRQ